MTQDDDILDEMGEENEEKKKKKGEGSDSGAMTRGEVNVTQGFFDTMARFGASKELVAEILRNWRHMTGDGLVKRLMDFARGLVKSSHVQVEIERGKDFAVMHNFIQSTKTLEPKQEQKVQHANIHKPATHGLDMNLTPKPK